MLDALDNDRPLFSHDGHWGKATLEVCLGIERSSRERRKVEMRWQSGYPSEARSAPSSLGESRGEGNQDTANALPSPQPFPGGEGAGPRASE